MQLWCLQNTHYPWLKHLIIAKYKDVLLQQIENKTNKNPLKLSNSVVKKNISFKEVNLKNPATSPSDA